MEAIHANPPAAATPAPPPGDGFIRTWIVGYAYHPATLFPGDSILVVREPDNLHDANAILVRNAKGLAAGYLPRHDARYLAPLLDQEKITLEARLAPATPAREDRIPVMLRIRFTAAGQALAGADPAPTPAALVHNVFATAWRDLARFNPGPLQQLREQLRPLAHECALKPATQLLYRLLKEPLAVATAAAPPANPFL